MDTGKQQAALSSVFAAVFLTSLKMVVGIFTGSLGILSEAAHSALDLCAAVITFFAVRFADKPADLKHHYGHGKIESFSALVETLLLLATCGWIMYEAVEKVLFAKKVAVIGSHWGIAIMVISILVDYSRVKILKKAAKEHNSQALEADALHFSSDVWSSAVVIAGLACVWIGNSFQIPVLNYADPLAALGVSVLVIVVSMKLGKQTIDVLLDTAPSGMKELIYDTVIGIRGVREIGDIKVRPSGSVSFVNIRVGLDRNVGHPAVFHLTNAIREGINQKIPTCDIFISTYPVERVEPSDAALHQRISGIIARFSNCINIHDIQIFELQDRKNVAAHIELAENLTLKESHDLSHQISSLIQAESPEIENVTITFECAEQELRTEDITESDQDIVTDIRTLIHQVEQKVNCHDIRLFRQDEKIATFLHCELNGDFTVDALKTLSDTITRELKNKIKRLDRVHIHFEPLEDLSKS